jgi:hydrogenase 3 maturation protease
MWMNLQPCWQQKLQADLKSRKKTDRPVRLAVLGVGHELYGDDAVGVWLTERLREALSGNNDFLSIPGGPAPENFTGSLRRFGPDLVLLVDAALMDLEPGQTGWLDWQDTTGFSASTHTLPLHLIASYLTAELNCKVDLLGIQPANCQVGEPLSPSVQAAADSILKDICNIVLPS